MPVSFDPFQETLLQHLQEGVCFIDSAQKVTLWNHAAEELSGCPSAEAIGASWRDVLVIGETIGLQHDADFPSPFEQAINAGQPRAFRLFLQHRHGHRLLITLKVLPIQIQAELSGAIGIFSDASHEAELEAATSSMKKLMRVDPLTHLPNKRSLLDSMKSEYLRFARYGTPFALIAIAIDPPAHADEPLDAPGRDALLKWFAQQLSIGFRKADTPARLRGATFLVLLPHAHTAAAELAAEKMRARFAVTPYPGSGQPITASFGCASVLRTDTLERLIDRARAALKSARAGTSGEARVVSL